MFVSYSRSLDESCTRMSPRSQRSRTNHLGYHDERKSLVRKTHFDGENVSWEEPVLDESGEFRVSEMSDVAS